MIKLHWKVTVALVDETGKEHATKSEDVPVGMPDSEFKDDADKLNYFIDEVGTALAAAAHNVEDCCS